MPQQFMTVSNLIQPQYQQVGRNVVWQPPQQPQGMPWVPPPWGGLPPVARVPGHVAYLQPQVPQQLPPPFSRQLPMPQQQQNFSPATDLLLKIIKRKQQLAQEAASRSQAGAPVWPMAKAQ